MNKLQRVWGTLMMLSCILAPALVAQESTVDNHVISQNNESESRNSSVASPLEETMSLDGAGASVDDTLDSTIDENTLLLGESPEDAALDLGGPEPINAWDIIRLILVLGLVVASIYGIYFIFKRIKSPESLEDEAISVLSTKSLTGSRNLHLIDVAGQLFLIGASDHGIQLIAEMENKEQIDELRFLASQKKVTKKSFQDVLGDFFANLGKGNPEKSVLEKKQSKAESPLSFMEKQRERLTKL